MLTLEFARSKIDHVLSTIEYFKAEDFPYSHSRDALEAVEGIFRRQIALLAKVNEKSDSHVVQTISQRTLELAANLLPVMGLIMRSTDVRNPLELHGPLLRLTHKAISDKAKLVISSEWDFSPFTLIYPELFKQQFVLVGLPMSESTNALVIPLAGHELGHNVWRIEGLKDVFGPKLETAIVDDIRGPKWHEFSKIFGITSKESVDDLATRSIWDLAWQWAVSYCEELFCDFIGLYIFRESFLYAFVYLLAPSGGVNRQLYPSSVSRAVAHAKAAAADAIKVPEGYEDLFMVDAPASMDAAKLLMSLADSAASSLHEELAKRARDFLTSRSIGRAPSATDLEQVEICFRRGVPTTNGDIATIINAAWQMYLADDHQWEDYPAIKAREQRGEFLNELVLKSLEISEIQALQAEHAPK